MAHINRYTWDPAKPPHENQVDFEFTDQVSVGRIATPVTVKVKDFNNVDLYNAQFDASSKGLQELAIAVNLPQPGPVGTGGTNTSPGNIDPTKKIRGKLVSLSKRCTLKGNVVLQARQIAGGPWMTVSTGVSDQEGNSNLPYP